MLLCAMNLKQSIFCLAQLITLIHILRYFFKISLCVKLIGLLAHISVNSCLLNCPITFYNLNVIEISLEHRGVIKPNCPLWPLIKLETHKTPRSVYVCRSSVCERKYPHYKTTIEEKKNVF